MGLFKNLVSEVKRDVRRKVRKGVKTAVVGNKKKTNVVEKAIIKTATDFLMGKRR